MVLFPAELSILLNKLSWKPRLTIYVYFYWLLIVRETTKYGLIDELNKIEILIVDRKGKMNLGFVTRRLCHSLPRGVHSCRPVFNQCFLDWIPPLLYNGFWASLSQPKFEFPVFLGWLLYSCPEHVSHFSAPSLVLVV